MSFRAKFGVGTSIDSIIDMKNLKDLDRISRISISLPTLLLEELDQVTRERGFESRSQAISEMVQSQLVLNRQRFGDNEMVGTISLVYNQLRNNCGFHLAEIQKKYPQYIVTSLHLQLPNQDTFENIMVQGPSQQLKAISDELITCKGVKVGQLNLSAHINKEDRRPFQSEQEQSMLSENIRINGSDSYKSY